MKEIRIVPLTEVNGVVFGEDRERVREAFGEFKEFKKSPFSNNTTDDFGSFHVYYDKDNKFEAVEVFGDTKVLVGDNVVFPGSIDDLINCIDGFVEENGFYTNYELSIGTSLSDDGIESMCFGCKDYYKN